VTSAHPAIRDLIGRLDEAVTLRDARQQTAAIKKILSDAIRSGGVPLAESFYEPKPDHYARRLLHRDAERGYSAVVMTWGPGQGTLLHDHAGIWCVEGTVHGEMEVIQFEISERDGENRYRFEPRGRVHAMPGASGALIPPFEYHILRNALADGVSLTLHVYGGEMDHCHVFEPVDAGWFERRRRALAYDA